MAERSKEQKRLTLLRREKWRTNTDYGRLEDEQRGRGRRQMPPITLSTQPLWTPPALDDDDA